jgi:hypothetical protein
MKWLARRDVGSARSSHSEGEWDRWFAWYPVVIATSKFSAQWVWLEFVERKWSAGIYGTGRKKRRYRLPKKEVRQRLRNLSELIGNLMPRGLGRDRVVRNYSVGDSTTSQNEAEARKK